MLRSLNITSYIFLLSSLFLLQSCADQDSYVDTEEVETIITAEMVQDIQDEWVDGLIAIGEANMHDGDPVATARQMLNEYYDFDGAGVLFKPTLTHGEQTFRFTKEGALSYFVGGNENYPNDTGFARGNYVEGTATIENVIVQDNIAITMGNIMLVNEGGGSVTVDKTFAYRLDHDGNLRIITHHSSLPYSP